MIIIGSDHAGYKEKENIKEFLKNSGIEFKDCGVFSQDSSDYPIIAKEVSVLVANHKNSKGILVCGSGIGMSIVANKFKGIRAALCSNSEIAKLARNHNNANVLCIGARTTESREIENIVKTFLESNFEGERHQRRIEQIKEIEKLF